MARPSKQLGEDDREDDVAGRFGVAAGARAQGEHEQVFEAAAVNRGQAPFAEPAGARQLGCRPRAQPLVAPGR